MEPRGFWADAIQMRPSDDLAFAPMDDAQQPTSTIVEKPADDVTGDDDTFNAPAAEAAADDLPF